MPRVLVCLDEVPPANGGACTTQAWVEQPASVLPDLTAAEVGQLVPQLAALFALAWAWKFISRNVYR